MNICIQVAESIRKYCFSITRRGLLIPGCMLVPFCVSFSVIAHAVKSALCDITFVFCSLEESYNQFLDDRT